MIFLETRLKRLILGSRKSGWYLSGKNLGNVERLDVWFGKKLGKRIEKVVEEMDSMEDWIKSGIWHNRKSVFIGFLYLQYPSGHYLLRKCNRKQENFQLFL